MNLGGDGIPIRDDPVSGLRVRDVPDLWRVAGSRGAAPNRDVTARGLVTAFRRLRMARRHRGRAESLCRHLWP